MSSLSKIVNVGVYHDRASNNAVLTAELDKAVDYTALANPISSSLDISKISDVPLLVLRGAVVLAEGVIVGPSTVMEKVRTRSIEGGIIGEWKCLRDK